MDMGRIQFSLDALLQRALSPKAFLASLRQNVRSVCAIGSLSLIVHGHVGFLYTYPHDVWWRTCMYMDVEFKR